jgi:long-chain acyl-CoA synthetase
MMLWTQLHRNNPVYLSMDLKNLVQEMSVAAPMFYLNVPAILERIRTGVETKINEKGGLIARSYKKAMELGFKKDRTFSENLKLKALSILILSSIRKKNWKKFNIFNLRISCSSSRYPKMVSNFGHQHSSSLWFD